ncbi:MAG: hypothetical protein ACD_40C00331G0009 [uncultured bacterium]|nr:MAG: hypothetical protein ACD_40C00331G0009 [uncultured bacterium]
MLEEVMPGIISKDSSYSPPQLKPTLDDYPLFEQFKTQLLDQAYQVNDLLGKYIKIHDHRLKTTGSFRSLFNKVDFEQIFNFVNDLYLEFDDKYRDIVAMRGDYPEYTKVQQTYLGCLEDYFECLFDAVKILHVIANRQNDLSKGFAKGILTLTENLDWDKKYREGIEKYRSKGSKLNTAFDKLSTEIITE